MYAFRFFHQVHFAREQIPVCKSIHFPFQTVAPNDACMKNSTPIDLNKLLSYQRFAQDDKSMFPIRVHPRLSAVRIVLSRAFKQSGRALASAHAHGHHAIARLPPFHFVCHGTHHARASHAERMPNGN
jgi:hypothetical protein